MYEQLKRDYWPTIQKVSKKTGDPFLAIGMGIIFAAGIIALLAA